MPSIQDIYRQTGKQATPREIGRATATGGALGGITQMVMEALKKRKKAKPIPPNTMIAPTRQKMSPEGMKTLERKYREIKAGEGMQMQKPAKELRGLNQFKRWAY